MEFEANPSLWGPQYKRAQRFERAQQFAEAVLARIEPIPDVGDLDFFFEQVRDQFVGKKLTAFIEHLPATTGSNVEEGYDDRTFKRMVKRLRGGELPGLDEDDHRPARTLLLVTAERSIIPYFEGALEAIRTWPRGRRLDIRSAFHVITRWEEDREPKLAKLVAAALAKDCQPQPWGPFTRFFDGVLEFYERHPADRTAAAIELSQMTTGTLYREIRRRSKKGHILRELMAGAERIGVLGSRPPLAIAPKAHTRFAVTELLLVRTLELSPDPEILALLDLLHET